MIEKQTCADLIEERMKSRSYDARLLLSALEKDLLNEDDEDEKQVLDDIEKEGYDEDSIHEFPLSVEIIKTMKVQFSTGGPADWIEFKLEDGYIYDVKYVYQDWFDVATMSVPKDTYLYDYAQYCAEIHDYQ